MDRAGRRFLVASTLLAIPVALMMASLSSGVTPGETEGEITHAVGEAVDQGAVQQVVGKQLESRKTRPGLLQVLSGSKDRGSTNHTHSNMSKSEPKGLLDGLFGTDNKSKSVHKHSNHSAHQHSNHATSGHKTSGNQLRTSGQTDRESWDDIPYHQVSKSGRKTGPAPIRDPNTRVARSNSRPATGSGASGTRIIRGGASTRKIQARPASARIPSTPTLAKAPAAPTPAPRLARAPTQNVAPAPSNFSSSQSSRRSSRKSVQALDASEIAAAAKKPTAKKRPVESTSDADLVPRIVRKEVKKEEAPAKPASKEVTETKVATAKPVPKPAPAPAAAPKAAVAPAPAAGTALAAIGAPTTSSEPASPSQTVPTSPKQPATKSYTLPVDPQTTPVPVAGLPTHPYAASTPAGGTPANMVSHRAGPPSAAFKSNPQLNPSQPQLMQTQQQFATAAVPVGSGVAPRSDVASYRHQHQAVASQQSITPQATAPAYQIAQQPTRGSYDPYAARRNVAMKSSMTTHGQPAALSGMRPASDTAAMPTQPITAYDQQTQPRVPAGLGDNFTPMVQGSRNQMRDAAGKARGGASSELPGIRVVTVGPDAIMIRQTSQYEIRVENRGSIDAEGVMVRALVPDWADLRSQSASRGGIDTVTQGSAERLVWTIDHLPAGSSERMFVRLTAARSGTYNIDVDWTLAPQKSVAKVQVREPRLDLTIEGPDQVVFGQSQTYKVRVLNPGDGVAPNVVFTLSPDSTPQTQRIGDIPPGKEAQFEVELTAQDLGDLKIHGLANGDYDLRAESTKTIRVAAARLEAELSGPELKYQNTEAMYSLQLENTGQATSDRIVATLRLPGGVQYLGGIEGATIQGNVLRWEVNSLPPAATRSYQFRCGMSSTGEHLFAFECKGSAAGNADVALSTRVESISDLVLTVSDPTAPAPIGSDVTYEIIIRNRGSKEANDVRAIAQFSHGIEPQRIEGQSGEIVTGQVLFDSIPRIGAGQEVRLRVIAEAERAGHHRFRTEVRAGDTVLVAEEATHYMSPKSDRVSRRSTNGTIR